MISAVEQEVYDVLNKISIKYSRYEHKAVFTVDEACDIDILIPGFHCKNLFLKNKKGDVHYLVVLDQRKHVDLKDLAKQINSSALSFASPERLLKYLGLTPGSVTPFGLINDKDREVIVVLDDDLKDQSLINFHPNINTATIGISHQDLEKFIKWHQNEFMYVKIK